jgi:hypothetical protein
MDLNNVPNTLDMIGLTYSLIATETFIRGMRDSGYRSTATAMNEFIDNAIQAQADVIDVVMVYSPENVSRKTLDAVAVVDNGHGMDPSVLRLAVQWGGTHRERDRTGFGRFGFGLPSAAISRPASPRSAAPTMRGNGVNIYAKR